MYSVYFLYSGKNEMGLSDEQKAIKIHESGIELNNTFLKKLPTGRRHEKYTDIA